MGRSTSYFPIPIGRSSDEWLLSDDDSQAIDFKIKKKPTEIYESSSETEIDQKIKTHIHYGDIKDIRDKTHIHYGDR